jgi:diaminopimelate decarboxylase
MAFSLEQTHFFGNSDPAQLVKTYGSPLYVYNEEILRTRCREMADLVGRPNFRVNYSTKANANLALLKIVHEEGLCADAMSPGEIYMLQQAGFTPEEIFYIGNNVSAEEMEYAVERGVPVSVDSLSQLEMLGKRHPGTKVAVRLNPGVGAGHHEKVVTAGKETKFGINLDKVDAALEISICYGLTIVGVNQHIGSLFMEGEAYAEAVSVALEAARRFPELQFVDLGGGFGIPYHKHDGEARLNLRDLGKRIRRMIAKWDDTYGREITFIIEPGRYIAAECGTLLGTVHAMKDNDGTRYAGTDLGLNVLLRPELYGSHHDIEVYRDGKLIADGPTEVVNVVGNICETGDYVAKERELPAMQEGDIVAVLDAGAYGYTMSSNYNNRLRPAEVLVNTEGNHRLIRKRETLEDLTKGFVE